MTLFNRVIPITSEQEEAVRPMKTKIRTHKKLTERENAQWIDRNGCFFFKDENDYMFGLDAEHFIFTHI